MKRFLKCKYDKDLIKKNELGLVELKNELLSKNNVMDIAWDLAFFLLELENKPDPIPITSEQKELLLSLFKERGVRIDKDGNEVKDNRGGSRYRGMTDKLKENL